MKKFLILPFLFSISNILFLYSQNVHQVHLSDIFFPLIIILIFTFISVLLLLLIYRDINKAVIINMIILLIFFFYGHIYNLIDGWKFGDYLLSRHRYLLFLCGLSFLFSIYIINKNTSYLNKVIKYLFIVTFSSIFISVLSIGAYQYEINTVDYNKMKRDQNKESTKIDLEKTSDMRDIYYIILDGYASESTLQDFYNYNNNNFINYLSERGFYVASKSLTNYVLSPLSIASSLNMEYLNYLTDFTKQVGIEPSDRNVLHQKIKISNVMESLKLIGYKFIHFSSGWGPTNGNKLADYNINTALGNEFLMVLFQTTAVKAFEKFISFTKTQERRRRLETFSQLGELHDIKGPKFIFAHIMCPHPPFLFDANGAPIPDTMLKMDGGIWQQKTNYLNQLIFVTKKVKFMIHEILKHSELAPIIIIQSDHGPSSTFVGNGWKYPNENMYKERTRILNALYLPSVDDNLLYDNISPVNTFRLIFNLYYNSNYDLLDDISYWSPGGYSNLYEFIDVTEKAKYD